MIGTTLSHYRIVEEIGSGGMGAVYLARDERLDRLVALKVLTGCEGTPESRRAEFRKEALALSRLNHPNIETVYDFDVQNGVDFLILEVLTGPSLSDKLKEGPLPEREVAELGAMAAEGLAAAHEAGVIHRDIKPANLRLTSDGRLKIIDFGLSTMRDPSRSPEETIRLSESPTLAGTLQYMAPEQLLGKPLDARADVYSLGVVLFELATGRHPFPETLATALIGAVLHVDPPAPRMVNPGISAAMDAVIRKAMARDPQSRYASAQELARELRRIASRPAGAAPPATAPEAPDSARRGGSIESIVVLPLEDLGRDPEEEYFADGMTEALIAGLAKIGSLRVISRTSAMQYKGTRAPLPQIARELHVDAVIEGSVLRSGDRVRITARLIEAATDRNLWAETYERDLGDILALQSEVARAIAGEIQIRLTPQEQASLARVWSVDAGAYQLYLKGRYQWEKRSEESLRRAHEYFRQAIDRDPTYAAAYAGLADYYITLANFNLMAAAEAFPKAKAAAARALDLDPSLAEAHTSMGSIRGSYEWDRAGAEESFKRAIELNPNYATAHHWHADHLVTLKRFDEGLAEITRAQAIDPLTLMITTDRSGYLFYARRYDEAYAHARRAVELDPLFAPSYRQLGGICEQLGRLDEAIAAFTTVRDLTQGSTSSLTALAHANALAGGEGEARGLLAELEALSKSKYVSSYGLAAVHVALGEVDRAFEWLDRALRDHDRALIWLPVAPRFDRIRSDPRMAPILRRIGAS
jgi:eukaryotic-like serine/threonine-protein kinase